MRICGGEAKGRMLIFPSRSEQRPTTDFLRENLFNVLKLQRGQNFLDLFAGSGSVGLEAASRGAKSITFVEKSKVLVDVLRKNIAACGYEAKCQIIRADIHAALVQLYRKQSNFDVVFADPPYHQGFIGATLQTLNEYPLINQDGLVVLQHSIREQVEGAKGNWIISDQRKYGDNVLTFIRMGIS